MLYDNINDNLIFWGVIIYFFERIFFITIFFTWPTLLIIYLLFPVEEGRVGQTRKLRFV